jgi:hypothetical protein
MSSALNPPASPIAMPISTGHSLFDGFRKPESDPA